MTDSATVERDYLAELARRPAARSPATIGEIWSSEWTRSGLDTLTGIGKPLDDAYAELVRRTEAAAGKPIGDFVPQLADAASTDERARLIGAAIATLPEEQRAPLEPLTDVRRRAAEAAQKTEREASEVYAASSGISGVATSWAAGIARQALDPVNLATLPLGGPLKGPLLKTILRAAAIGGLTQAAQEPAIETGRAELGLEAGFGRGATNVAEAALGAGGLTVLFRAGAWATRKAFSGADVRAPESAGAVFEGAPVLEPGRTLISAPAEPVIGSRLVPEDFAALAARAERDQLVDQVAPLQTAAGLQAHAASVEGAAASIERGRDIEGAQNTLHTPETLAVAKYLEQVAKNPDDSPELRRLFSDVLQAHGADVEGAAASIERGREIAAPTEAERATSAVNQEAPSGSTPAEMRRLFIQSYKRKLDKIGIWQARAEQEAQRVKAPGSEVVDVAAGRVEDLPFPENMRVEAPPAPQVAESRAGLANIDQQISAPKPLGDPVLAKEFDRVLAEAGDFEVHLGDRKMKASEGMQLAETDATAARELTECIGVSA